MAKSVIKPRPRRPRRPPPQLSAVEFQLIAIIRNAVSRLTDIDTKRAVLKALNRKDVSGAIASLPWTRFRNELNRAEIALLKGMEYGGINGGIDGLGDFDPTHYRAIEQARRQSAKLVTNIDAAARIAIRNIMIDGLIKGQNVALLSDRIGRIAGLDARYARAVANYESGLINKGASPAYVEKSARRYADRLQKSRAVRIARTELATAANLGRQESWQQAIENGVFGAGVKKRWLTGPNSCPVCKKMSGKTAEMDGGFVVNGRYVETPPAHPSCSCILVLDFDTQVKKHLPGQHDQRKHGRKRSLFTPASTRLWRGLFLGSYSESEAQSMIADPEQTIKNAITGHAHPGIHWTDNPNSAWNFAQDRDPDGYAHDYGDYGDEEYAQWQMGVIFEGEVSDDDIIQEGSEEWEGYSMGEAIFAHDHPENEVTIRDDSHIVVREAELVWTTPDGGDGFRRVIFDSPIYKHGDKSDPDYKLKHPGTPGQGGTGRRRAPSITTRGIPDRRIGATQSPTHLFDPRTGKSLGKDAGEVFEELLWMKGVPSLRRGLKISKWVRISGGGTSRTTAVDFRAGRYGVEVKTISTKAANQKSAIKRDEKDRKLKYVKKNGLTPLTLIQRVDPYTGKVTFHAYKGDFVSRTWKKMDRVGSYRFTPKDLMRAIDNVKGRVRKWMMRE